MNALTHFQAGRLTDAIAAATAAVKSRPSDLSERVMLCHLLGFAGQWDRLDRQLDAMTQLSPETAVNASVWRQVARAAQARAEFFATGRLPEFVSPPSGDLQLRLRASIALREKNLAEAAELLRQAEEERPRTSGVCDGRPFDDCRDLDDLTASFLEVLTTTGKYYWVPLDRVVSLAFQPPADARDLLWRPAEIVVHDGPTGTVFLPVVYPSSDSSADESLRLGRATDWRMEAEGLVLGVGQRMFLFGNAAGGDERNMLDLGEIEFTTP
jgi:type VI secretion system protein ImpE